MNAKHTPGLVIRWGDARAYLDPGDGHGYIATVRARPTKTNNVQEYQDFANLFAAAPETAAERDRLKAINAEMLAVLSAVVDDCDHEQDRHNRARFHSSRMARAAIAKARGET